jgi:hypothetical protein
MRWDAMRCARWDEMGWEEMGDEMGLPSQVKLIPAEAIQMKDHLLRDASLVANLPADGGRGERGDLGHQLTRPLALAQQEDASVEALPHTWHMRERVRVRVRVRGW